MSNCGSFQAQLASILEALAKSAIAEITKLVDDGSAALRFEMCRSQSENDMLRRKLLRMERELRAVRGYGEETPDNSLDISFEVQVCDEFGEAQIHEDDNNRLTPEKIPSGRAEGCCSVSMKMEDSRLQSAPIKREPVDGEQDWSESLLLSEDRVEEDPNTSQSQVEQKSLNNFGVSRAAAVDCGEGPLYEEEEGLHLQHCLTGSPEKGQQVELKQDPEGWPLNAPPNLLKVQCVWSEAGSLGRISGKHRPHGGKDKQRDVQVNLDCAEEFQGATPGNKDMTYRPTAKDPLSQKIRLSSKEKMARYRARINNDPIARAEKLAKRRQWYQLRKAKGFLDHAPISALSAEEVEKRRCQWRVAQRRRRERSRRVMEAMSLAPTDLVTSGDSAQAGTYVFAALQASP